MRLASKKLCPSRKGFHQKRLPRTCSLRSGIEPRWISRTGTGIEGIGRVRILTKIRLLFQRMRESFYSNGRPTSRWFGRVSYIRTYVIAWEKDLLPLGFDSYLIGIEPNQTFGYHRFQSAVTYLLEFSICCSLDQLLCPSLENEYRIGGLLSTLARAGDRGVRFRLVERSRTGP